MVEKDSFSTRFEALKGQRSYSELSDDIFRKTGVRISAQAMNKWILKNGGISLANVDAIARYFDVTPEWLLYGVESSPKTPVVEELFQALPPDPQQLVLNLLGTALTQNASVIASDKMADYMIMIERIKKDIARRKSEDGSK